MINRLEWFWQELTRRRVVRSAAAYAAVSFIILQLGEILLPAFGGSPTNLRRIVAALLAAFPVALAVSWVYDISASGFRRTRDTESDVSKGPTAIDRVSRRLVLVVLGAAAALGGAGWWFVGGDVATGYIPVSYPLLFVAAAFLGTVGWWSVREPDTDSSPSVGASSIAILPFAYWGAAGEQGYLGEALADEILTLLAGVPGVRVTARTSSFAYRDSSVDVRLVGRALGVGTLLEGSVLRNDSHLRVTAQLIDTQTGFRVWSKTYEYDIDGSLDAQDEIAHAIVGEILACPDGPRGLARPNGPTVLADRSPPSNSLARARVPSSDPPHRHPA